MNTACIIITLISCWIALSVIGGYALYTLFKAITSSRKEEKVEDDPLEVTTTEWEKTFRVSKEDALRLMQIRENYGCRKTDIRIQNIARLLRKVEAEELKSLFS